MTFGTIGKLIREELRLKNARGLAIAAKNSWETNCHSADHPSDIVLPIILQGPVKPFTD